MTKTKEEKLQVFSWQSCSMNMKFNGLSAVRCCSILKVWFPTFTISI